MRDERIADIEVRVMVTLNCTLVKDSDTEEVDILSISRVSLPVITEVYEALDADGDLEQLVHAYDKATS